MSETEIFRWIMTALFGLIWLLLTIGNVTSLISARRRGGTTSLGLFIGGIAGAMAMLVCPFPGLKMWAWVPALLDPGSLPALAAIAIDRGKQRGHKGAADKPIQPTTGKTGSS